MACKIAVPNKNGRVDPHYGSCDIFSIFTIDTEAGNRIGGQTDISARALRGCKTGIADELKRAGVKQVLVAEIGPSAARALGARGIQVVAGAAGPVRDALERHLAGVSPC